MKLYTKNNEVKRLQDIVIVANGMRTINPSEEMIFADGWVEYIEPTPKDSVEKARERKVQEVLNYDSSDRVNEFSVNNYPMWLDKATRVGLVLRFQSEKAFGKTETTLWYNGFQFAMPIELGEQMLCAIENYASACYDNTQSHIAVINTLESIEEIEVYNYRDGYPDKLNFNI